MKDKYLVLLKGNFSTIEHYSNLENIEDVKKEYIKKSGVSWINGDRIWKIKRD